MGFKQYLRHEYTVHLDETSSIEDWEKDQLRARWLPITDPDPFSNPNLKYAIPRLSSPFAWMRRRPRLPRRLASRPLR